MRVLVAGANGQVGHRVVLMLAKAGHEVRAMIRDESQASGMQKIGGEPVVADLEGDVSGTAAGCDAVVFSAGGGPGSGPKKKETIDRQGAVKLIEAAKQHGVPRYIMVSAMGAADPESGSEAMKPYLRAKARADEALQESGLAYTIIRPGRLTNGPGTGRIEVGSPSLERHGEIPREDVASVIAVSLEDERTSNKTFEVLSGDTPIEDALASL